MSLADLAARFPDAGAQVRILPNLAARIGAGVTAVATLGDADDAAIAALLDPLGQTVTLADDSTMDLVTAFTGSGPAFVFRLIESYAAAGERLGLSAEDSLALATATFGGATALLADSGEKPGVLIAQVASKGGTTQAGLDVLDSDGQLRRCSPMCCAQRATAGANWPIWRAARAKPDRAPAPQCACGRAPGPTPR